MFCKNCGKEIDDKAFVCTNCGVKVQEEAKSEPVSQPNIIINNANTNTNTNMNGNGGGYAISPKSKMVTLLLAIFVGYFGIHRFYVGKIGTGIIWLLTAGMFGIGWIIDIIMILCGSFRDSYGMLIKH